MGWQEAKKRHEDSLSLTSYAATELIARRIMAGLGYSMSRLPDLERALGLPQDYDAPALDRAEAVLRGMAIRSGKGWVFGDSREFPGLFRLETMDMDRRRKAITDLAPILDAVIQSPLPLYLTRVTGTTVSKAYFLVGHEFLTEIEWLKPPFTVLSEHGMRWLVEQETAQFIGQFGPYTFGPEDCG